MTKPSGLQKAAVAYSFHALEQLPDGLSRDALQQMAAVSRNAIVCLEPIRELFPKSLRGFTSRLRQRRAHYLSGLPGHARSLGLNVVTQELLGQAENPLNEPSEFLIEL
jgi:hypothetical protein